MAQLLRGVLIERYNSLRHHSVLGIGDRVLKYYTVVAVTFLRSLTSLGLTRSSPPGVIVMIVLSQPT